MYSKDQGSNGRKNIEIKLGIMIGGNPIPPGFEGKLIHKFSHKSCLYVTYDLMLVPIILQIYLSFSFFLLALK